MRTYVLLDRAEERGVAERWRDTHDPGELQKLIESCLPWIYKQAARFARTSRVSCEDLVQAGVQGVCEAAWKFEPEHGLRFLTYARTWIHGTMQQAMTKELAVRPPKVRDAAGRNHLAPVFEHQLGGFLLVTPDPAPLPDERLMRAEEPVAARRDVARLLGRLTDRERQIITLLYLHERPRNPSFEEVARSLQVSRERVRQLHNRALEKMRRHPSRGHERFS